MDSFQRKKIKQRGVRGVWGKRDERFTKIDLCLLRNILKSIELPVLLLLQRFYNLTRVLAAHMRVFFNSCEFCLFVFCFVFCS